MCSSVWLYAACHINNRDTHDASSAFYEITDTRVDSVTEYRDDNS